MTHSDIPPFANTMMRLVRVLVPMLSLSSVESWRSTSGLEASTRATSAFVPSSIQTQRRRSVDVDSYRTPIAQQHQECLRQPIARTMIGKLFEESGPLGKGITVAKVQVALDCEANRSILKTMEQSAKSFNPDSPSQLAKLANSVCLALLRKSQDWVSASSTSKWFSQRDAGRAESLHNTWSNREAAKFEKEYIPDDDSGSGGPTVAVISLVVELEGDTTQLEGAGYSIAGTQEVLSSLASDALVDGGRCLRAAEIFWTPSERKEVLTRRDVVLDFPELIDF